jgi:hypothetical protein
MVDQLRMRKAIVPFSCAMWEMSWSTGARTPGMGKGLISCACASYCTILWRNVGNELVTWRTGGGGGGWLTSCACARKLYHSLAQCGK